MARECIAAGRESFISDNTSFGVNLSILGLTSWFFT